MDVSASQLILFLFAFGILIGVSLKLSANKDCISITFIGQLHLQLLMENKDIFEHARQRRNAILYRTRH